jgi:hypothetical protein
MPQFSSISQFLCSQSSHPGRLASQNSTDLTIFFIFFCNPSAWTTEKTSFPTVPLLDSIGFWRRCITHRINGFLDFIHHLDSKELEDKNMTFRKLDLFPSSGEGRHLLCWVPYKELTSITDTDVIQWNPHVMILDLKLSPHLLFTFSDPMSVTSAWNFFHLIFSILLHWLTIQFLKMQPLVYSLQAQHKNLYFQGYPYKLNSLI